MNRIVAVAKSGINVLTETNPNNFIFHSAYNTFKILSQQSTTITTIAGSNIYTIAHNAIKTPPLFFIFAKFPDGKVCPLSFIGFISYNNASNGSDGHSIDAVWWDNTNIYIYIGSAPVYSISIVWIEAEPELS